MPFLADHTVIIVWIADASENLAKDNVGKVLLDYMQKRLFLKL
jgi:hypothetical protein